MFLSAKKIRAKGYTRKKFMHKQNAEKLIAANNGPSLSTVEINFEKEAKESMSMITKKHTL